MSKLIINADDFGLTNGINQGILDSILNGVVCSTTILANGDCFLEAVKLAKRYHLVVGVHLNLTLGRPITQQYSLVTNDGFFDKEKILDENYHFSPKEMNEIEQELISQIDYVINAGITPCHLDSHHHCYMRNGQLQSLISKLANRYHLPIRIDHYFMDSACNEIKTSDYFIHDFDDIFFKKHPHVSYKQLYYKLIDRCKQYDTVEVMVHPGIVDEDLKKISTMLQSREITLRVLKDPLFLSILQKKHISLITYGDL